MMMMMVVVVMMMMMILMMMMMMMVMMMVMMIMVFGWLPTLTSGRSWFFFKVAKWSLDWFGPSICLQSANAAPFPAQATSSVESQVFRRICFHPLRDMAMERPCFGIYPWWMCQDDTSCWSLWSNLLLALDTSAIQHLLHTCCSSLRFLQGYNNDVYWWFHPSTYGSSLETDSVSNFLSNNRYSCPHSVHISVSAVLSKCCDIHCNSALCKRGCNAMSCNAMTVHQGI